MRCGLTASSSPPCWAATQRGQSPPPSAVPQLGCCASSGHAWRLWAAWHSQGEAGPLRAPPVPRVLEPAASKAADSTTFDPSGDTLSEMYATEGLNPGRAGRVPHRPATHTCAPRLGQALLLRARGLRAQGRRGEAHVAARHGLRLRRAAAGMHAHTCTHMPPACAPLHACMCAHLT